MILDLLELAGDLIGGLVDLFTGKRRRHDRRR
jgi:hypothetical protein